MNNRTIEVFVQGQVNDGQNTVCPGIEGAQVFLLYRTEPHAGWVCREDKTNFSGAAKFSFSASPDTEIFLVCTIVGLQPNFYKIPANTPHITFTSDFIIDATTNVYNPTSPQTNPFPFVGDKVEIRLTPKNYLNANLRISTPKSLSGNNLSVVFPAVSPGRVSVPITIDLPEYDVASRLRKIEHNTEDNDAIEKKIIGLFFPAKEIIYPNVSAKFTHQYPVEIAQVTKPPVTLTRTATEFTADTAFFRAILNSTEALGFNSYQTYMDWLFCDGPQPGNSGFESSRAGGKKAEAQRLNKERLLPFTGSDAYRAIKAATEAFVMVNCGVMTEKLPFDPANDDLYFRQRDLMPPPIGGLETVFNNTYLSQANGVEKILPYLAVIRKKLPDLPIKNVSFDDVLNGDVRAENCYGILQQKLQNPCLLELIWSYWHEEGMLVQSMNSISRRFQNIQAPGARDPLVGVEIDPLRPLSNLLWTYVQDEQHRLSVMRRNYEYDHHYGLRLDGRAVQNLRPADSRSKFLEAFHNLLRVLPSFYKQDDDTTVKADAFPILNALKEVHLILSEGAHNQFGDLPSTARIEMLMQQWLLARPEFREFLPTRVMVAYPEPWMDRVDAMKKLQGWTDVSVVHFRNLAVFGEQLLLSIRWGHWSDTHEPLQAFNWARCFRPQIQGYLHAYRAATGADLAATQENTLPSVLLRRRLDQQQRRA